MSDFLKMDIFFATTTAAVFLFAAFLIVGLYYLIRILKNIDHITRNVSEESDRMREDIGVLRSKIRDEGMKVRHFLDFFSSMTSRKVKQKTTKTTHRKTDAE